MLDGGCRSLSGSKMEGMLNSCQSCSHLTFLTEQPSFAEITVPYLRSLLPYCQHDVQCKLLEVTLDPNLSASYRKWDRKTHQGLSFWAESMNGERKNSP